MKKFSVIALILLISGCTALEPYVREFNVVSVDDEKQMSEKMASEISNKKNIVKDPVLNARVSSIGHRLVEKLPPQPFDFQFFVIEDKTPNAFTIPGAKIYVHTGLFGLISDDNELAGVLAHEIGHAYRRHPAKNVSRAYGAERIAEMLVNDPQSKLKIMALQIAAGGMLLRYSREDELEADSTGFHLLCASGYRTNGLANFLKKLQSMERRGMQLTMLSTHPATSERVTRLENMKC